MTLLLTLAGALAFALPFAPAGDAPHAVVGGAVGAVAGWLGAKDLRTHRLPNRVVVPAAVLLAGVLLGWGLTAGRTAGVGDALLGGALSGGALLLLSLLTGGAIGLGDVKLGALLGLWTGWLDPWAPVAALVAAFVAGGLAALAGLATRRATLATRLPFAPALALGAALATWWTRWGF